MKKIIYILTILFIISCKQKTEKLLYLAESKRDSEFLFRLNREKDSIKGIMIDLNHKDSLPIKGIVKNNIFKFIGRSNRKEELHFDKKIWACIKSDNETLKLRPIIKKEYDSIFEQYLFPETAYKYLKKDTIIGDYLFEIRMKNWLQSTKKADTEIRIKDKNTNKLIQTMFSKDWIIYIQKNMFIFYYNEDYNFDGYNDLIFFKGFIDVPDSENVKAYPRPTHEYYLFDKESNSFVLNKQLSDLEKDEYYISFDPKNKRIIRKTLTMEYSQREVFVFEEDSLKLKLKSLFYSDKNFILNHEEVNNKWKITKKHFPKDSVNQIYEKWKKDKSNDLK